MSTRSQPWSRVTTLRLLVSIFITGCAPTALPVRPPDNYQGPIAEGPLLQADDYWIYGKTDGSRMKLGAGTLLSKLEFPLWLGKTWKYADSASMLGGPATGRRTPVEIECVTAAFESITVTAGTFEAFRCQCHCWVTNAGFYDPACGTWNAWYAPRAKNVVLLKTESTASSTELLEYKVTDRVSQSAARPENPALSSAAKNAVAFNKSGDDYRRKGDYDRAIQEYDQAIRLDPNYAVAFNNRGTAYRAKRDYNRAIADYDRAIGLNPNNATFFNNRGNAYRDRGEHDRAIQEYNQAIRLNPNYVLAFVNRGVTHARKLDYERAIGDYDQAIKLDPSNAGAFNNRGNAQRNSRNYPSALTDYETAARLDPKLAQQRAIGITLYYLGRMAESAIALERRFKIAPQDAYAILWRYLSVAKDQGQQTALRDLAENATKLENHLWPAPVVDFYLGKIDQKAMYAAANNPDAKKTAEQICEANFYAGEAALLRSTLEEAISLLRLAERDCPKTFYESHGASVELGRVGN